MPLWNVIERGHAVRGVSSNAHAATQRFREFIAESTDEISGGNLVDRVQQFIEKTGYYRELERLYTDPNERESRLAAVEEVVNAVGEYERRGGKHATLRGFLDDMALSDRDQNDDKDKQLAKNAIALMTYHSSKGLEFPQVYMVGMEENLLPHHRAVASEGSAIDEERRLCYVGITRAQERLTMSLALSRTKWGRPRPTQASRFLFELTGRMESGDDDAPLGTRVDATHGNTATSARKMKSAHARQSRSR